ncbi:MAG TPA: NAD(P)-dependent oxidoreductase [Thermoleophilaceae bacterium]|nr:NAD(P)-dependent oxidoreductase [Thermoleophilaceae bacterium]
MTVALLGTGTMGAPMARNLARAGLPAVAWNRTPAKAEALTADGVRPTATPEEAAAVADQLVTMLADGPAIEAVLGGSDGALGALPDGAVWIQMSTVGAPWADRLAALAADHAVHFVDAPVLGSAEPAERGELTVLASGPDEVRDRCAPIFDAVGARTVWLGRAGIGSRLKVVVNAWLMATTAALGETIALAERLDVDPAWFLDVTDRGAIGALYTDSNGPAMADRAFPLNFPLELATKDAALALEAAGDAAAELRVFAATHAQFARAQQLGHGRSDWAAVIYASEPHG